MDYRPCIAAGTFEPPTARSGGHAPGTPKVAPLAAANPLQTWYGTGIPIKDIQFLETYKF